MARKPQPKTNAVVDDADAEIARLTTRNEQLEQENAELQATAHKLEQANAELDIRVNNINDKWEARYLNHKKNAEAFEKIAEVFNAL